MDDCLFCKIISGELESDKIYEDEHVCAFKDKFPDTPVHILVVPKRHIQSLGHVEESDLEILGRLQIAVAEVAKIVGVHDDGYRVVTNIGENGRQSVLHLHYHILGGKKLPIHVDGK